MVEAVAVHSQQGLGHTVVEGKRLAVDWQLVVPKEEGSLIGIGEEWRRWPCLGISIQGRHWT